MEPLLVTWRGKCYSVATCLSKEKAAKFKAGWPGGVIDLIEMYDGERPSTLSERNYLTRVVLNAVGEKRPPARGDQSAYLKELGAAPAPPSRPLRGRDVRLQPPAV
jgi:hypothetical protein